MILDPKPALVLIDLQAGIVALPLIRPGAEIVASAARLADAFRANHLPVVLVTVSGSPSGRTDEASPIRSFPAGWDTLVDELDGHPEDHRVVKRTRGAFVGTDLEQSLRSHGVTQIVLAGIATSAGVESTARHAFDLGFTIAFVADATTDRSAEAHAHSLERVFPRFGEITTADEVIALLAARTATR